ncbi:hypothetical protein BDV12DRAFT_162600 [Aspergillus spectabilis]
MMPSFGRRLDNTSAARTRRRHLWILMPGSTYKRRRLRGASCVWHGEHIGSNISITSLCPLINIAVMVSGKTSEMVDLCWVPVKLGSSPE